MESFSGSRSPWTAKRYHDTAENAAEVLWKRLGRHQKMYLLVLLSSSCQIKGEKDNLTRSARVQNVSLVSKSYDFPVGRLVISAMESALVFNPRGMFALCSCVRHFTLIVPLSIQMYKWVKANLMLGVNL